MSTDQTFSDACTRYEVRREEARAATSDELHRAITERLIPVQLIGVELTGITDACLDLSRTWTLPWGRIVGQFRPYVRRFELALWCNGILLGLAIGRASRGNDNVTIHYLERNRSEDDFRGWLLPIAIDADDNFAKLTDRQWLKVKNPVAPLVPRYEAIGFELAMPIRGSTYYRRRVA